MEIFLIKLVGFVQNIHVFLCDLDQILLLYLVGLLVTALLDLNTVPACLRVLFGNDNGLMTVENRLAHQVFDSDSIVDIQFFVEV